MKKFVFFILLFLTSAPGTLMAQQAYVPKAANALTKETLLSLRDGAGIPGEQVVKVYPVFEDFYTAMQSTIAEMRIYGNNTAEEINKAWENLSVARDERLVNIFTEGEMAKWQKKIEPSLRLQRIKEEQKY